MKILSWNVNGIRAVEKKGFIEYIKNSGYDLIGLQETKAESSHLSEERGLLRKYRLSQAYIS